jgi:hypothetical protein
VNKLEEFYKAALFADSEDISEMIENWNRVKLFAPSFRLNRTLRRIHRRKKHV